MPPNGKIPEVHSRFLSKAERYCAYQERCTHDVKQKLNEWRVPPGERSTIINRLTETGFIHDLRYSRNYASGKFHHNKWGRKKIRIGLQRKEIPESIISKALESIDPDEYLNGLKSLMIKKEQEINSENSLNKREKIITFVIGKGYEPDLVFQMLKNLIS